MKNTKNHCLAYVRYINNINLQNLRKAGLFLDILNRSLDNEASKLLADLRDVRLPNKIESVNLQRLLYYFIFKIKKQIAISKEKYFLLTKNCFQKKIFLKKKKKKKNNLKR